MKYLIGLCGTHGTGKSTILQGVKAAGYAVNEAQLSRTAQKNLGWDTLGRAQESDKNMWALQDAIIDALEARDQAVQDSGVFTLVERTPADLWAYTAMWCQRLGIDTATDQRAIDYRARCDRLALNYLRFMVVVPDASIPFQEDPHRADLASRRFVEREIDSFLFRGAYPTYIIKTTAREHRIAEACALMRTPLIAPSKDHI